MTNATLDVISGPMIKVKTNPPSFPNRLERPKKQDKEKEILEILRKVEINILLLDAVKQVPKYMKFLKNFCVNKKKLREDEQIIIGENIFAILQIKLLPKYGDSDMFTIPCKIKNLKIRNAMLDLEIFINVISKSIYDSLNLESLKEIRVIVG